MTRDLDPSTALAGSGDGGNAIKPGHLDGSVALTEDQDVVVYDEQVPADKIRWAGHGHEALPTGVAHKYADLVASGSGTGSQGDPVEADLYVRITDSAGNDELASRTMGDADTLRDAESEQRTERPAQPAMAPYARPHRRIQIVANADAPSDGVQIDTDASSCRFWYTETDA